MTPRRFENQKALQDYAEANDLTYVWEGMKAFSKRWRLAQSAQAGIYELVDVRTTRGVTRALLFPKAILQAEFEAAAPMRDAPAKKKSWRASLIRKRSRYLGFMSNRILGYVDAPDRASAEAAAVSAFSLTEEQRKRLVVQQQDQRKRLVVQEQQG